MDEHKDQHKTIFNIQ